MRSTAPPCWYCGGVLQELVHVLEPETAPDHEHLQPVQQLRDLLGQRVVGLVLGGEPHLARLFEDLLALCMDARVERGDRCRACWTRRGLLAQLGEQLVERLHRSSPLTPPSLMGRAPSDCARPFPLLHPALTVRREELLLPTVARRRAERIARYDGRYHATRSPRASA